MATAGVLGEGCSSGETGLVLGRPLPAPFQSGAAGATGATGGTSATPGGEPGLGDGAASTTGGDAAGAAAEPPWVGERCTPTLEFSNSTAQKQLFNDAVPDPSAVVWAAAHASCRVLFRDAAEVKDVPTITLIVEDAAGIASTSGSTIRMSTRYLQSAADRGLNLTQEIAGILHFSTSLVYQNGGSDMDAAPPGWLVVGIADFVRLESGYIDRAQRKPGGTYNSGPSQATAFFLDYLATRDPDIVYKLNRELSPASPVWSDDRFITLMGSDVATLWNQYQSTL